MGWLELIIISAATLSLYDIAKKHSVRENRAFAVLLATSASGFAAVAAFLAFRGKLACAIAIEPRHIALLLAKSAIVGASWSFAYWALKTLPVSVMSPIRATGPIWTTLAAIMIFGETPSPRQALAFAITFAGSIAFSLAAKREGFTFRSRAMILALLATLFGAASALYDKLLLQKLAIDPLVTLFWFMGGMCVIYLAANIATIKLDKTKLEWRWTIPAVGVLLALSDFLYFSAISQPEARISIVSTIRRTSVIATFFIGGAVFRETNLLGKAIALAAILAGVILLAL